MMPASLRWRSSTSCTCFFSPRARQDAVDEIRTIERADQLERLAQGELRRDVAADTRRGRRRVGVEADAGKSRAQGASWRYSGRKSWPHWLMQCASSMAMNDTSAAAEQRGSSRAPLPPGAPARRRAARSCLSNPFHDRGTASAGMRAVVAGGGDAVVDQRVHLVLHQRDQRRHHDPEARSTSAGAWKQSDLPPPVGMTTSESRSSRIACMASRCRGRNEL